MSVIFRCIWGLRHAHHIKILSYSSIYIFKMVASEMQKAIQHIQICWTSINTWKNGSNTSFDPICYLIYCHKRHNWIILTLHIASSWPDGHNLKTITWDLNILGWHPPWNSFLIRTIGVSKLRTSCTKVENYPEIWSCHGRTLGTSQGNLRWRGLQKEASDAKIVHVWVEENSDFVLFSQD